MVVIFHTNIDKYRTIEFPDMGGHVPRKGEMVKVHPKFDSYCQSNRIPNRLEVCAVRYQHSDMYHGTIALVELWFNETDFKLYGGGERLLN